MATKNNPGKFDCYDKAEPDEPMFILLARDPIAPMLVRLWAEITNKTSLSDTFEKQYEAMNCASAMEAWRENNR